MPPPLTGLILAGGQSRRFGSNKALHELEGRPLVQRVYEVLSGVADPILVSVSRPEMAYPIPVRRVADRYPGCGPLAGLQAGLEAASTEWALVVAVDLPFVTRTALQSLIERADPEVDAVIAYGASRLQPLCGCYRTTLAPFIEARLFAGERSVLGFLDTIEVAHVSLPESCLRNINRPGDLADR